MGRIFISALVLFFASSSIAEANGLPMQIYPSYGPPLSAGKLYAIEINCTPKADLPSNANRWFAPIVGQDKKTLTHFVVVGQKQTVAKLSAPTTTDAATMLADVFTTDGATVSTTDHRSGGCAQNKLIYSPSALYIDAVAIYSKNRSSSQIDSLFNDVLKAANSIAPLLTGDALNANVSKKLTSIPAAATPVQSIADLFNPDESSFDQKDGELTEDSVTSGVRHTTQVVTTYSIVTISVRPVTSIVDDSNSQYLQDFLTTLYASNTKLDGSSTDGALHQQCDALALLLNQAGFTSSKDVALGIYMLALHQGITDHIKLINCLGIERARTVLSLVNQLSTRLSSDSILTKSEIDRATPPTVQTSGLTFNQIEGPMAGFLDYVGGYSKSATVSPEQAKGFGEWLSKDVTLDNKFYNLGDTRNVAKGYPGILQYLMSKGYYHFGFYGAETGTVSSEHSGAVVGFLAIHADKAANSASVVDCVPLFPTFNLGKISRIEIGNNRDEVRALVMAHTSTDNGFTISLQPPPQSPTVGTPPAQVAPTPTPAPGKAQ